MPRVSVPINIRREVLAESGYRCAVPTCRGILAIDLHHIEEVSDGGGNDPVNLIALCPTCHALYTRGTITKDAILAWKSILIALNHAFDQETVSNLLFLNSLPDMTLGVSGDGVLKFSGLIASGLATFNLQMQNGPMLLYMVKITDKGKRLVNAWFSGNVGETGL